MKLYTNQFSITIALMLTLAAQVLIVPTTTAATFQTLTNYEARSYLNAGDSGTPVIYSLFAITPGPINPDSCSLIRNGYSSNYYRSTLREAALNNKTVVIALRGCDDFGRPIVVSVGIQN